MIPDEVLDRITASIGPLDRNAVSTVSGGSINRSSLLVTTNGSRYFLKLNDVSAREMFEAEREGLSELNAAAAVRVPETFDCGTAGKTAFLLMEYLDLGVKSSDSGARLGDLLASQHRKLAASFGWHRANTIGSTPQLNDRTDDWTDFLWHKRLGYQLELVARKGFGDQLRGRGERLRSRLPEFFESYDPAPSLLHGDLWGGNWGELQTGEPVIFDPAVYFGDRESDLAMTRLFGGFGPEFYAAYNESWPLDPGFEDRIDLYNLYHVLNHLNLFGEGYLHQASAILDRLLR